MRRAEDAPPRIRCTIPARIPAHAALRALGADLQLPMEADGHPGGAMGSNVLEGSHRPAHGRGTHDEIRTITGEVFQERVLDGDGPIAVEFMSYGCGYCRALEPALQQVAAALKAKVQIFRVNIGVEGTLATDYLVQGTPTIVLFRDGREVARLEGPPPSAETLLETMTAAFDP